MSVPDHKTIAYECENGHLNADHDINHAADEGKKAVCQECDALLTKQLVPMYECNACGHTWAYTGSADRPTCPECKGKNVAPVASEGDQ